MIIKFELQIDLESSSSEEDVKQAVIEWLFDNMPVVIEEEDIVIDSLHIN